MGQRMGSPALNQPLPDDETQLIIRAQCGEHEAFARLVSRYWDKLYRWLCHLTRDGHTAEDLAQETFLKAYAAVGRFRAGSNFRAWLFRIAHNNFVNQRRVTKNTRQTLSAEWTECEARPEDILISKETIAHLAEVVSRLPTDFRAALLLRVEGDLSFKEIAQIMNTTEQTARWRVFKARQKLMLTLEPDLLPHERESHRKSK